MGDNKIIRFYNQNRLLVWVIIVTIIGVLALIYVLNSFLMKQNLEQTINAEANINNTQQKILDHF